MSTIVCVDPNPVLMGLSWNDAYEYLKEYDICPIGIRRLAWSADRVLHYQKHKDVYSSSLQGKTLLLTEVRLTLADLDTKDWQVIDLSTGKVIDLDELEGMEYLIQEFPTR